MADINLVTGKLGTPHVSSADDGSLNAAIFGEGAYVLNRGQKLRAEVINSNTVRIYDGDFCMQGRQARVDTNTYVDLTIENGSQGMKRNDLICVRYEKDIDTLNETAQLIVIKGTESAGTAVDPAYTEGDIFNGDAVAEFPLYRIPLNGITVGTPVMIADQTTNLRFIEEGSVFDLDTGIYYCSSDVTGFDTAGGHYVQVYKRGEQYKLIIAYDFGSSGNNVFLYWYMGSVSTIVRKKIALSAV